MRLSKVFPAAILIALASANSARALDLSLVGSMNLAATTNSEVGGVEVSSKPGFGFGALLNIGLLPGTTIETGALWSGRKVGSTGAGFDSTLKSDHLIVPVIGRVWLGDLFSVGAGPYMSFALGDAKTEGTVPAGFTAPPIDKNDFGLLASGQLRISVAPMTSLVADVRYMLGLTDITSATTTDNQWRDFQFLAGVNFGF